MFEIVKLSHITAKKSGKQFTIVLITVESENDINYYKLFIPGTRVADQIVLMKLCRVGYTIGLSDGEEVYSAEKII